MVKTNSQQIKIITTAAEAFIKSVPQTVKELYSKNLGSEIIGPVQGSPI